MKQIIKKQTVEHSQFTYEEITDMVKHNKPLAELIETIFNTYDDIVIFESNFPYDMEYNIIAHQNLDFKNDKHYDGDGWEESYMEVNYEKFFQFHEDREFISGEGDAFRWDAVRIDDNRLISVRNEEDYVAIDIITDDDLVDGYIDSKHLYG